MSTELMITMITKSPPVVVKPLTSPPATPPTAAEEPHSIKLSSFDKVLAFTSFTSFLIFDNPIPNPAATIRGALSRALVHYFPAAGRAIAVTTPAADELHISCTGEGVHFVSASATFSLTDAKLFHPPFAGLLRDLAVVFPGAGGGGGGGGETTTTCCRESDPLLLVQVTEFACGGFVVGATWNHALADGTGMAHLLRAVGDLARGLPQPSLLPVSCGGDVGASFPELPPLVNFIEKTMVRLPPQAGLVYQDITVPWKIIDRVRSDFAAGDGEEEPCTVFEAVVAVLWQCRTRVVMSGDDDSDDAPAPLVFAANVRRHVGAREGYFGNCVTSAVTVPRRVDVAHGDVKDVVRIIKRAKMGIPGQFVKKKNGVDDVAGNGKEEEEDDGGGGGRRRRRWKVDYHCAPMTTTAAETTTDQQQLAGDVLFGYDAFYVSSWRNLGFDAADMGGGTPARVMCHVELTAVPNCVACVPCGGKGKEGANVLALCVREEHADAFVAALRDFAVV